MLGHALDLPVLSGIGDVAYAVFTIAAIAAMALVHTYYNSRHAPRNGGPTTRTRPMSRRRRRTVTVVLLCAALSLSLGVGSYDAVSADRSVAVSVVADDEAYLGVADELQCGYGRDNELLYNRLPGELTSVTVTATVEGGRLQLGEPGSKGTYADGETATLELGPAAPGEALRVQVASPGNVTTADTLRIDVRAEGSTVDVTLTDRSVAVDCPTRPNRETGNGTDSDGTPPNS